MRSSAGYIHRTPVRIHCGKCNTLLTGHFISDDANAKAYFEPGNCTEVSARPYDYYGEASGELLCRKITYLPDEGLTIPTTLSPAMSFLMSIETEERDHFIDFACHLASMREAWDKERIFYDLVINKKSDVLKRNYAHIAEINGYSLESEVGVLCYYYYSYFTNIGGVFTKKNLISNLRTVNYEINHLGHSDVKYNGTDQTIEYVPNHRKPSDSRSAFLLDVAIQCVELMQSSVILSMIIYKLSFLLKNADTTSVQMHPIFYSGTHGSSRCPCGSGLPFRKCCKPIVSKYAKGFKMPTIMNHSNTAYDAGQID